MPKTDKRIDAYIAKSPDFAKPILARVREIVHEGCSDCEETLKWSAPTFMYNGAILCGMVAFKEHRIFHFWKGQLFVPNADKDGAGSTEARREAQAGARRAGSAHRRAQEEQEGQRDVRGVLAERAARVRGVDRGREDRRHTRLSDRATEWMAEGKKRNWKYQ